MQAAIARSSSRAGAADPDVVGTTRLPRRVDIAGAASGDRRRGRRDLSRPRRRTERRGRSTSSDRSPSWVEFLVDALRRGRRRRQRGRSLRSSRTSTVASRWRWSCVMPPGCAVAMAASSTSTIDTVDALGWRARHTAADPRSLRGAGTGGGDPGHQRGGSRRSRWPTWLRTPRSRPRRPHCFDRRAWRGARVARSASSTSVRPHTDDPRLAGRAIAGDPPQAADQGSGPRRRRGAHRRRPCSATETDVAQRPPSNRAT